MAWISERFSSGRATLIPSGGFWTVGGGKRVRGEGGKGGGRGEANQVFGFLS